jgi:dihydrolipoamide dehydrogenase
MSFKNFDCIVIGAGPAGYAAAIKLSQLGKTVAVIESANKLGGTCLRVGCIPSKALLSASHDFWQAQHTFHKKGIETNGLTLNLRKMMDHKDNIVLDLTRGIQHLFDKNKIVLFQGLAEFVDSRTVMVKNNEGNIETLQAPHVIIATGSKPQTVPNINIDEKYIVSSTGALSLSSVPKHLVIIGAGYIGLELGTVWQRLGAKVTVIEYSENILMQLDPDVRSVLHTALEKKGFVFKFNHKVVGATIHNEDSNNKTKTNNLKESEGKVCLHVLPASANQNDAPELIMCDAVLVAVGRKPATDTLMLNKAGVSCDAKGYIEVSKNYETIVAGVYAIGDCIKGPMLAHKAMDEGVALAEQLAGQAGSVNYGVIPAVIFTQPEIATVGRSEEELKNLKIVYKIGKFPYSANGRARTIDETVGFVKILSDTKTDRVLGCAIVGADAGTMIAQIASIMEFGGTAEDIARTCHAHPTLNEIIKEAAWAAFAKPLHS